MAGFNRNGPRDTLPARSHPATDTLRTWRSAAITLLQIACTVWSVGACADDSISLVDALATLRSQGQQIFYSSDAVTPSQRITVPYVNLETVKAAAASLGLEFIRRDNLWLVVRNPAMRPSLTLHVVSTSGAELMSAEFQFGGQPHPVTVRGSAGTFVVQWPQHTSGMLTIRARDHYPRTISVSQIDGPIALQPIDLIENVIVVGSRHIVPTRIAAEPAVAITSDELNGTPALAGDSMRITNRLPGMSTVGVSAKPLVRGGVQDETLTVLDGIEVLDPYHLADFQSIFSSVDSRIVSQIDVYTGGFPTRYGNRMSGVVEISTLNRDVEPRTEVGLSVLSAFANTRGAADSTDWVASARHGNLEYLADWIDPNWGTPAFDDAYIRIGRQLNEDVKAYVGALYSRDDTSITDNDRDARSDIETSYWWTRLDVAHGDSLRSSTVLTLIDSDRNKRERSTDPDVSVGLLDYGQQMRKGALRTDFSFQRGLQKMEFGVELTYADASYDARAAIDRGAIGALLGDASKVFDIHTHPSGWSGGAYWSGELWLTDRLALQPGIRWDFQDYGEAAASQVSPRFGVRWDATDTTTLRLSAGRYCQPEGIHEMKAADGLDRFLAPQKSNHVVGSMDWAPRAGVRAQVETYFKDYRQARTRFENLFNPFVLTPELEPDRVAIVVGHAMVKGLDAQFRFDPTPALALSIGYGYMDADDRIEGNWKPRAWSQRHTAQTMLAWQTETASASVAMTWHSGWRTTRLPASVPIGTQLPLAAIYDNGILNDYVSLDLSLSQTWMLGRTSITAEADLTNALNHANHGGVDYDSLSLPAQLLLVPNNKALLPWIPTMGIIVAF